MPISDNGTRDQYTATAAQTIFPYTFEIFDEDDIAVEQNGTLLTKGTHYTVSGVNNDSGGNVTLVTGATAGDILTLYRNMALERVTDYQNSGDFLADTVDNDFDRLWAAMQQVYTKAKASIRAPVDDPILNESNTELADIATRGGRALGFAADGTLTYLSSAIAGGDFTDVTTTAAMTALSGVSVGDVVQTAEFSTGNGGGGTYDVVLTSSVIPNGIDIIEGVADPSVSFVLRIKQKVISSQFGVVDDGTDMTANMERMFTVAASEGKPVWLERVSSGTISYRPTSTTDLSGIPSMDGAGITIDTQSATASPIFKCEGSRSSVLASAFSITAGEDLTPTISTNDLDVDDVFVLISLEALPNSNRTEYYKSGLYTVYSNDGAGNIVCQPSIPYDYTSSAYLYRIDMQKFDIGRGLTFLGKTASAQEFINLIFCESHIKCTIKGFNGDAVKYITSIGSFTGTIRSASGLATEGGGVDINDASDVLVNAEIYAPFHAVDSGGATGTWNGSYAGGSAGTPVALSARFVVSGGIYSSSSTLNGTINAHGNADKATVGDCQINGSTLNLSARVNTVSNVQIEGEQAILLRWGADNNSTDWCDVQIYNTRVKRYKALSTNFGAVMFEEGQYAKDVLINGLRVEADYAGNNILQSPLVIQGQCKSIQTDNVKLNNLNNARAMYCELYDNTVYEFKNIYCADNNRVHLVAHQNEVDVNVRLEEVKTRDHTSTSSIILAVETGANFDKVDVIDCESINSASHGLDVTNVKRLTVKGGDFSENNASGSANGVNALLTQTLKINGTNLSNTGRPFDQTQYPATASTAQVVGCDVTGATGGMDGSLGAGCTWEARSANMGDNRDFFRQDDGNLYYYDQSGGIWVAV